MCPVSPPPVSGAGEESPTWMGIASLASCLGPCLSRSYIWGTGEAGPQSEVETRRAAPCGAVGKDTKVPGWPGGVSSVELLQSACAHPTLHELHEAQLTVPVRAVLSVFCTNNVPSFTGGGGRDIPLMVCSALRKAGRKKVTTPN